MFLTSYRGERIVLKVLSVFKIAYFHCRVRDNFHKHLEDCSSQPSLLFWLNNLLNRIMTFRLVIGAIVQMRGQNRIRQEI